MIEQCKYDIIFLDHMMPEMDGIQVFQAMKQMEHPNQDTPVIVLTANAMAGVREEYLALGFFDYLSKPINSAQLEMIIGELLPENKKQKQ